jgi:multiple sugar transport system substrate-binding protein
MRKLSWLGLTMVVSVLGCGSKGSTLRKPDAAPESDGGLVDGPFGGDASVRADARDGAAAPDGRDAGAPNALDAAATDAPDTAPVDAPAGDVTTGPEAGGVADGPDGGDAADPGGAAVTIKFWRHDNASFRRAEDDAFADYVATHPNVTIAPTTTTWQTYTGALASDLANDRFAYDLVLMPPSATCSYAANLEDVPAGVVTVGAAENTFFAGPLEGSLCGGKLKAVPVEYNLEYGGVVVDLDRYQARYPNKQPSWPDWTTFLSQASALSRFDAGGKPCTNGLDIDPDWPEPVRHIFLSQILQRGGRYWSASDPRLFDFNTQQAHDALADMVAWVNRDKVLSTALFPEKNTFVTLRLVRGATGYGCGDDVSQPLSVMGYLGTWGLEAALAERPAGVQTRFDYFPLPPMVGTEHKFVQNAGFALAVPRTSKNAAAAWDLVKAIALSPAAMRKWAATAGTLPALQANGTPAAAAANPLLAKVQPLLGKGHWMGYIPYGSTEAVLGAMVSNFNAAVKGTKTVDQALADLQATANQAIMRNQ